MYVVRNHLVGDQRLEHQWLYVRVSDVRYIEPKHAIYKNWLDLQRSVDQLSLRLPDLAGIVNS
jgi:hypothetical protein